MKRIVSLILTLIMLFGALTTLVSCGAPKDDGAEINVYLGSQVFDFDPSDYYVSAAAEQVLGLLYEPLFTVNAKGKLKMAAAKDYEVDEDERKIVIELRDSYWSDNIKVTASDFVYAWCERIINAKYPNPAAALFLEIEGVKEAMNGEGSISDVAIKATERDQLTITYCEGADYKRILKNLATVATSPVRQDIVESAETTWSKTPNSIATNGAFRLKSYDKETGEFELSRNLGYHQDPKVKDYDNKVRPGMLYGEFTVPGTDIKLTYEDIRNKVTFIMADASLGDRVEYKKKAKTADHTSVYTYVFNTSHPLFADANVRLALSTAIDREAIIEAITFGDAANGFIPDVSGGAKEDFISKNADMTKAKEYLADADQAIVSANKAFTLTVNDDEESKKIAELVEKAWEELEFDVTVKYASTVATELSDGSVIFDSEIQYLIKDVANGVVKTDDNGKEVLLYDVIAVDWQTFGKDALVGLASLTSNLNGMGTEFYSGTPGQSADTSKARTNVAYWADAEFDNLVADAMKSTNKKERAEKLAKAEEYLMSKMPVCPLVFNETFVFVGSKISKFKFDGFGKINLTDLKLANYKKFYKPEKIEE